MSATAGPLQAAQRSGRGPGSLFGTVNLSMHADSDLFVFYKLVA